MKKSLQMIVLLLISNYSFGQMLMTAEGIKPENACNPNAVYFLIENRARPIVSKDSIEVKLNNYVHLPKRIQHSPENHLYNLSLIVEEKMVVDFT